MAWSSKSLVALGAAGTLAVIALAAAAFVASGTYYVGADRSHSDAVSALLQTTREQSVEAHSAGLHVPDLGEQARIVQGAGNYDAMCVQCHGSPGSAETELSRGLSPAPPNLSRVEVDAAEAFWVIKHGIRMTGMPAWGESMDDEYIWNMVAFIRQMPTLDAGQYRTLVASSDGHSHGGGESGQHAHDGGGGAHPHGDAGQAHDDAEQGAGHHGASAADPQAASPDTGIVHKHADGSDHVHAAAPLDAREPKAPAEPTDPGVENAHDGHDHQH